jgi:hypothetical protein
MGLSPITPLSNRDMAAQSAMLTLLRAGAPSSEILLAKDLDALVSLGARLGIPIAALPAVGSSPHANASDDSAADELGSYNVRRFTPPPSAFTHDGGVSPEALARARARRQMQRSPFEIDPPTGDSTSASPVSPSRSFTRSPPGQLA